MSDELVRQRVGQYLAWAHQALRTARLTLEHEDYITTVNRAYYKQLLQEMGIIS